MYRDDPWLYVHGSARNPVNEYVFPEDIYNQKKMEKLFSLVQRGCFQGHTHVPGVFTESRNFMTPEEIELRLPVRRPEVHGQRRLGRPAARRRPAPCYVIQEDRQLTFRRVDYDFGVTANKIYNIPELDDFLGDRIKQGQVAAERNMTRHDGRETRRQGSESIGELSNTPCLRRLPVSLSCQCESKQGILLRGSTTNFIAFLALSVAVLLLSNLLFPPPQRPKPQGWPPGARRPARQAAEAAATPKARRRAGASRPTSSPAGGADEPWPVASPTWPRPVPLAVRHARLARSRDAATACW